MHRFFIATDGQRRLGEGEHFSLPTTIAHQVRDVLHIGVQEQLILLDNSGDELLCEVSASSRALVDVTVLERRPGKNESSVQIILCQGMLKSARFEWILEKGTELGVSIFAPMFCQRSISGLESAGASKLQRWQRILQEAAEQCGRARIPELWPIRSLAQTFDALTSETVKIMPWEEEQAIHLHQALQAIRRLPGQNVTVALFIGPEGGLTQQEVILAQQHHTTVVSLGSRILRAETAALATVANAIYELEA